MAQASSQDAAWTSLYSSLTARSQIAKFANARNDSTLRKEFKALISAVGTEGSALERVEVPGYGDTLMMFRDTETGNIFDPYTYKVYGSTSDATTGVNEKAEANQQFKKERTPEQGQGFRDSILTGGRGLAGTTPAVLRRAGTLLVGIDRENEFILS